MCGHSHCGAMGALLDRQHFEDLPETIKQWLHFAETTKTRVDSDEESRSEEQTIEAYVDQNVSVQLNHLKTLPSVASRMVQKKLQLHGWVFHIETGEIMVCDPDSGQFSPFMDYYARERLATT